MSCIEQVLEAAPHKASATYHPSRKLSKLDERDMRDTAVTYSRQPLHMDGQRQDDQLEPTYKIDTGCSLEDLPEVMDDREG